MRFRFRSIHLVIAAAILFACSVLAHVHGQTIDTTSTQLQASVDQYKHQVDSLQSLSPMPTRQFYAAARNLSAARAAMFLYIAKTDPQRALLAAKTAQLYGRRAFAFAMKAEQR
jgi:hypothetical protein